MSLLPYPFLELKHDSWQCGSPLAPGGRWHEDEGQYPADGREKDRFGI